MQLGGHRYMMKNEQPYCFNCYMERYAKVSFEVLSFIKKRLHLDRLKRSFMYV